MPRGSRPVHASSRPIAVLPRPARYTRRQQQISGAVVWNAGTPVVKSRPWHDPRDLAGDARSRQTRQRIDPTCLAPALKHGVSRPNLVPRTHARTQPRPAAPHCSEDTFSHRNVSFCLGKGSPRLGSNPSCFSSPFRRKSQFSHAGHGRRRVWDWGACGADVNAGTTRRWRRLCRPAPPPRSETLFLQPCRTRPP